jgi:hypothetical protein
MAAPEYVPHTLAEQPRRGLDLPPAARWAPDDEKHLGPRPGDLGPDQPRGPLLGSPGPDQGYALKLARLREAGLKLAKGEKADDVMIGVVLVAMKRASLFGRAPVIHDIDLPLGVWGYFDDAPDDLVDARRPLFEAAANPHHYEEQRRIVDAVPEATLRMTPAQAREQARANWRGLLRLAESG